jgi:hypothetical protein
LRIALIGNCQVQSLSACAAAMLDAQEILVFDYSEPYSRDEAQRQAFADRLGTCDWIIAQTASMSHTSELDLRPRYGGKLITIANFYFRGLFPDSCYIGDFSHRLQAPLTVHSVVVLDAFLRGLSAKAAVKHLNIETMQRLELLDAWDSSMAEMRSRESTGTVDVPAADMLEDACRRYPAFLTMNHPSAPLLSDYLHRVFACAGIKHREINALNMADPLAHHDTTPILDEVAEHLRLPYRVSQRWKINSLGARYVDREEFVCACYDAYRLAPPGSLLVHSPVDLVAALRSDPRRAYLVDAVHAALLAPSENGLGSLAEVDTAMVREEVARQVRPVLQSLAEISLYLHKVHSFQEVADPKIEQLVQSAARTEAHIEELREALKPTALSGRVEPRWRRAFRPRWEQ